MAENNVNHANRGSIGKENEDLKSSEETPQRTEEERKETRKGFKMLMETTAKFDELEPHEVIAFFSKIIIISMTLKSNDLRICT